MNPVSRRTFSLGAATWALGLVLATAGAALAQEPPQAAFGATVDVRVVNVEVVVTDRDGTPVTGLTKDDFELRVDGRPVAISNFYASERRLPAAELVTAAAAPARAAAPVAEIAPPRRLIVWIDDLSMVPGHRNRILRQLADFLAEQERLGTEILLARFDRSVEGVRPFGERKRRLADDLKELERRAGSGVFLEVGRRETLREIREIYSDSVCARTDDMEAVARRFADPLRGDVLAGLKGLESWIRSLAGLEGRKAVLFVSDGLPTVPGQEAYLLIDQLCDETTAWKTADSLVDDLHSITAAANAAGVTFYTLDAAGLQGNVSAADFGPGLDAGVAQMARANLQDSLSSFASETGGRALFDSNRVEPLVAALASDFEAYYSLGFAPDGESDGRAHAIEVRLHNPELKVRHRSGFVDRPAAERAADRLYAALRFGDGDSGADPLGVVLESGEVKGIDKSTASVPIRVLVPAARLTFLPTADGEAARLEITVVASDDEGRLSPEERRTLTVPRDKLAADLGQAIVRVPLDLRLRRGRATVAVAVRDLGGQSESIVRRELLVR